MTLRSAAQVVTDHAMSGEVVVVAARHPVLDDHLVGLGVELQTDAAPVAEGVGAQLRARQLDGAGRDGEAVDVPGEPRSGHDDLGGQGFQLDPADLVAGRLLHRSTERGRQRLTSEAEAEDRHTMAVGGAQAIEFTVDPRTDRLTVVHTLNRPEGEDEIELGGIGEQHFGVTDADGVHHLDHVQLIAVVDQSLAGQPGRAVRFVLDDQAAAHPVRIPGDSRVIGRRIPHRTEQNVAVPKPRIAVTTWRRVIPTFISEFTDLFTLGAEYPASVAAAGGLPILLPHHDPADCADVLAGFDGLVMVGGDDVDPARYGQHDQGCNKGVSESADASDLGFARAAMGMGMPIFAICRGYQVLNVAMGGTLHQDMTTPDGIHRPIGSVPAEVMGTRHPVTIAAGSRLSAAYDGSTHHTVNSIHHQAVDAVAPGFRAVAWAPDGTIEAIEPTDVACRVLAVQWHPEKIVDEGDASLFRHFVDQMVRAG